ncbi:hypothetical protein ABK040_015554 [Willaertia magna]
MLYGFGYYDTNSKSIVFLVSEGGGKYKDRKFGEFKCPISSFKFVNYFVENNNDLVVFDFHREHNSVELGRFKFTDNVLGVNKGVIVTEDSNNQEYLVIPQAVIEENSSYYLDFYQTDKFCELQQIKKYK